MNIIEKFKSLFRKSDKSVATKVVPLTEVVAVRPITKVSQSNPLRVAPASKLLVKPDGYKLHHEVNHKRSSDRTEGIVSKGPTTIRNNKYQGYQRRAGIWYDDQNCIVDDMMDLACLSIMITDNFGFVTDSTVDQGTPYQETIVLGTPNDNTQVFDVQPVYEPVERQEPASVGSYEPEAPSWSNSHHTYSEPSSSSDSSSSSSDSSWSSSSDSSSDSSSSDSSSYSSSD